VFNLHGVELDDYDYALNTLAPTLEAEKRKGKIRHIGVTENPIADYTNEMLKSALRDPDNVHNLSHFQDWRLLLEWRSKR
jgi:hypothetical protein